MNSLIACGFFALGFIVCAGTAAQPKAAMSDEPIGLLLDKLPENKGRVLLMAWAEENRKLLRDFMKGDLPSKSAGGERFKTMNTVIKMPFARPTPSFEPAKALLLSISRQLQNGQDAGLVGKEFQQAAISLLIGEIQDALEKFRDGPAI